MNILKILKHKVTIAQGDYM